jgi:putative hemolysin
MCRPFPNTLRPSTCCGRCSPRVRRSDSCSTKAAEFRGSSPELLAEELFGEILAEREKPSRSIIPTSNSEQGSGPREYVVQGSVPVHELNRELGTDLPIGPSASTLGGQILAAHGTFPTRGTRVALPGGAEAEIVEASPRRVILVRLRLVES